MSKRTLFWGLMLDAALAAILFGWWQRSYLAGLFMLAVLVLQVRLAKVLP
jgi:hypothetical protein